MVRRWWQAAKVDNMVGIPGSKVETSMTCLARVRLEHLPSTSITSTTTTIKVSPPSKDLETPPNKEWKTP